MFEWPFREAFTKGVRPDDRNEPNTQWLRFCYNLSATPWGLRPVRTLVQPITDAALTAAGITKSYPWPQLFRMKAGYSLLFDNDAVFLVTESPTGNWTIAAISTYKWTDYDWAADTASANLITTGDEWHVIDLWNVWMAFNGSCIVFKTGFSSKVFVVDGVTIKTGAAYQDGRIFYGGFNSANLYALADWPTYLASLRGAVPTEEAKLLSSPMHTNWVWHSSIGMEDMLRFFSLTFMKYGSLAASPDTGFDANDMLWQRLAMRNESGGTPMPYGGTVNKLMQLGEHMIAYGSDGIMALSPLNMDEGKLFGHREIPGLGLRTGVKAGTNVRAAAGGNEYAQAFVDEANDLWVLNPNLEAQKLGYRHIFSALTNVMVHYDPQEREWYFSADDDLSYRLPTGGGLTRVRQNPTTVFFGRTNSATAPIAIYEEHAETNSRFRTEWFNAGKRKAVPQILRVNIEGSSGWTLYVYFRRTMTDTDQVSAASTGDGRGSYEFHVSGVQFYIYGTHTDPTTAELTALTVEMDDGSERRSVKKWQT